MKKIKEFYKKNNFIIFCFILIIIKLLLVQFLKIEYMNNLTIDDKLMYDLGVSLKDGNWLGDYNWLTLTKGIFYPLFISILSFLKIPYYLGLNIVYIIGICLLTYSIKYIVKNDMLRLLFFIILLFHPVTFSDGAMLRFYRNSLESIFMIYITAACLMLYYSKKNIYLKSLFLGIVLFFFSINREDWIWILVPVFIFSVLLIIKYKNIKPVLVVIILMVSCTQIIKTINYKYYGIYILNETKETHYKDFLLNIMSIKVDNETRGIWLNSDRLSIAFENSPTLKKVMNEYKKNTQTFSDKIIINNLLFIWNFKYFAEKSKMCNNAITCDKLWEKISIELEKSFEKGKIQKIFTFPTPFIFPIKSSEIPLLFDSFINGFDYIINLKELNVNFKTNNMSKKMEEEFTNFIHMNLVDDYYVFKIGSYEYPSVLYFGIFNKIIYFYKKLMILLLSIGICRIILNILNKNVKQDFIICSSIILFSVFVSVCMLSYVDVTTFKTINVHYLQGDYVLFIIGFLILVLGGDFKYEKNFLNNIISLFKRRKNN